MQIHPHGVGQSTPRHARPAKRNFSALVASLILSIALGYTPLLGSSMSIQPANAVGDCATDTPGLVNGSFETYPNPDTERLPGVFRGGWHGYAGGPAQILILDQNVPAQRLPGWKTTAGNQYLELQRQVAGREQNGTFRSGWYFDSHNAQPADGAVFAELNATEMSALYQDIEGVVGQTYYWSVKHRGRQFSTNEVDAMVVKIGAPGNLALQSDVYRYRPINDPYSGSPVYSESDPATVSTFLTALEDGWVKYQGSYTPSVSQTLRFQFEATSGNSVGNLLDDIQFSVLKACDATVTASAGVAVELDVLDAEITLGDDQRLGEIRLIGGGDGTISRSGDTIIFESDYNGDYEIEYDVLMDFEGEVLSESARIIFRVTGGLDPTQSPTLGSVGNLPAEPGPVFTSLPARNLLAGQTLRVTGNHLDQVTRLFIAGTEISFSNQSSTSLTLTLPAGLTAGAYDLEALSRSAGKYTYLQALFVIRIPKAISRTTKGLHLLQNSEIFTQVNAGKGRDPALNKVRCIVNSSSLEKSKVEATRLCAAVVKAHKGVSEFVIDPRSQMSHSQIFSRVYYGRKS